MKWAQSTFYPIPARATSDEMEKRCGVLIYGAPSSQPAYITVFVCGLSRYGISRSKDC